MSPLSRRRLTRPPFARSAPSTLPPWSRPFLAVLTASDLPLLLAGITLLRLLRLTGYNLSLTITALQVANQGQLLLATLLSGTIFVAMAGLSVSTGFLVWRSLAPTGGLGRAKAKRRSSSRALVAKVSIGASLAALLVTVPLRSAVLFVVASVALGGSIPFLHGRLTKMKQGGTRAERVLVVVNRRLIDFIVVAMGAGALVGALFALPARTIERVTTDDAVYDSVWVMGEQAGSTLLLNDHQEARWIESDAIVSRQICGAGKSASRSGTEALPQRWKEREPSTDLLDYAPCHR